MKDAIIAVVSTVIGTIVGWILGKVNLGKIHVSLSDFDESYYYTDPYSLSIPDKKDHELYCAKLSFTIRLYNSSSISRTIRDCVLECFDESHKLLCECPVKDEESRKQFAHGADYKSVEILNIPPYESADMKGVAFFHNIDQMYQIKSIRFRYSDARFRNHFLKFKSLDFDNVPRFNQSKENGGSQ